MLIETIIFYLLLLDSITCIFFTWFGEKWYVHHFRTISRLFPLAKGWAIYYLVLVLWAGTLIYRLSV